MSTLATNAITDASGGNTTTINGYTPTMSNMAGRNRLINSDMRIDQRNAGASVTPSSSTYTLDRWRVGVDTTQRMSFQQVADAPSGFTNSILCTVTTDGSASASNLLYLQQNIEGFNISDLGFGTASAKSVTVSFWVKSSVTGVKSISLINGTGLNRAYCTTYNINAANTWEYKTVTFPGDTTGTWATGNGNGLELHFNFQVGSTYDTTLNTWAAGRFYSASSVPDITDTLGATINFTGVQLEAGSVATPFEHVDYGEMLRRCQRYCVLLGGTDGETHVGAGLWYATTAAVYQMRLPVEMRAAPVLTNVSPTVLMYIQGGALFGDAPTLNTASKSSVEFYTPVSSGSATAGFGTSARYTAGKSLLTSEL